MLVPEVMPPGCTKCRLSESRTHITTWRGTVEEPEVLFVGEAPGASEDEVGMPFVGRSGKLLDKWIETLGVARFLVSNINRCRPPGNRTPLKDEKEACGPHLAQLILDARPRHIVALGRTSEGWLRENGYDVLFIYHPSYYLRGYRKWEPDVARLGKELEATAPLTAWLPGEPEEPAKKARGRKAAAAERTAKTVKKGAKAKAARPRKQARARAKGPGAEPE